MFPIDVSDCTRRARNRAIGTNICQIGADTCRIDNNIRGIDANIRALDAVLCAIDGNVRVVGSAE